MNKSSKNIPSQTIKKNLVLLLVSLFILVIFAILTHYYVLSIFLAIYVVFLVFSRPTKYGFLVISLTLVIFFGSSVPEAIFRIKSNSIQFANHPEQFFTNLFTKNSGLTAEVLDRDVLWMISIINQYDLKDYRISESMENRDTHQSIVEAAWPIRMETNSRNVFIRIQDLGAYKSCVTTTQNEEYALVQCP